MLARIKAKTVSMSLVALTVTIVLLGLVPAAQAEIRVSPNYRLNNDSSPFRGRDQAGLAVNPANPQHVVAVYANYLDSTCEASRSTDGGNTWSAPARLTPPSGGEPWFRQCSNTEGLSAYVEFGSGQNVYAVGVAQRQGPGFLRDSTALLYKSTDGGLTWQQGRIAMPGGEGHLSGSLTPGPDYYRPSIGIDRGAGQGGADRIHMVARDLRAQDNGACNPNTGAFVPPGQPGGQLPQNPCTPMRAAVSNDGGQTFSSPVKLGPHGINVADFPSKPVVNPDHSVAVAWRTAGIQGLIQVVRWDPTSQTWGTPIDVTKVVNTGTAVTSHVTPGPSTSASYPRMEGDPATGRVYMVFSQGSNGPTAPDTGYQGQDHFISPDSQVWFTRSIDGGQRWSQPQEISRKTSLPGAVTHQTRHPTISVSQGGRVNVVWHDRRHWYMGPGERNCTHSHIFCEDIRLGDTYYAHSSNGGDSFSQPLRINDRSRNNEVGYDTRPSGYWWFGPQSVTVGGGRQLVAWMDSREGNWHTDNDDIYLAKVDFNATGAAPGSYVDESTAVSRSVALSRLAYQGGTEGALIGGVRDWANPPSPPCVQQGANATCPIGSASRNASSVVIVNEGDAAGALAGTVLGRANPGPVLLSPPSGLPAAVKTEVSRIRPRRDRPDREPAAAFVIGDSGKLSDQVITDLRNAGVAAGQQIQRFSGSDAAIAKLIAERVDYRTAAEKTADVKAFDAVVIANPATPDAGAAAGLAAARRLPYLYVNSSAVPAETATALADLDVDKALVVGGPSAVSDGVLTELQTAMGAGSSATRLGGADQYATSKAVVDESKARGMPTNVAYFADGSKPIDAALVGGVAARATGMLVLAPAPLRSTAAGQASSFGLSGLSRMFLAGPPPPGGSTVPLPNAVGPVTPFAAGDSTAPSGRLSAKRRQRLGRFIRVSVSCLSEACTATVGASLRVPRVSSSKTFRLKRVTVKIPKGGKRTVKLRVSTRARRAARRALRARKRVRARIGLILRDDSNNTARLRRTVRLVR